MTAQSLKKLLPFSSSSHLTLGVELEFQIIDPITFDMISRAKDLIRQISASAYKELIKPEITQSMIEINSPIASSAKELHSELIKMRNFLSEEGNALGVAFCGGGIHPFEKWSLRKIFPIKRYKNLTHHFRYMSKRSNVFGQHVHIGCQNREDAIYLTHGLARYVPHFIAMNASSPFYQGADTGFDTARATLFTGFPTSGIMPPLVNWKAFSDHYFKMMKLGIITCIKDLYWDIRPKPEYGTVEIRVCDTPLILDQAVRVAAYIQALASFLLTKKRNVLTADLYYVYAHNRFQAARYGWDAIIIDPYTLKHISIEEDFNNTLIQVMPFANKLHSKAYLKEISVQSHRQQNDARLLRDIYKKVQNLQKVVKHQCLLWKSGDEGE